jgi:hypothetical protein
MTIARRPEFRKSQNPRPVRFRPASACIIEQTNVISSRSRLSFLNPGAGTGMGGAIFDVGQHPSVELNACNFLGNVALGGATRAAGAGGGYNGQAIGGAIYHNNGDLTIRGGRFAHNVAEGSLIGADRIAQGGAIYASPIDSAPGYDYVTNTYLAGVVFEANQAIAHGASMAAGGAVSNAGNVLTDVGSRFLRNTARSYGGTAYGGGLLHEHETNQTGTPYVPSATLRGTLFDGNLALGQSVLKGPVAQGFGGGIAFLNDPQATLPLISFKRNKATTAGDNLWGTYHENVS